jgi:hypothetical protein
VAHLGDHRFDLIQATVERIAAGRHMGQELFEAHDAAGLIEREQRPRLVRTESQAFTQGSDLVVGNGEAELGPQVRNLCLQVGDDVRTRVAALMWMGVVAKRAHVRRLPWLSHFRVAVGLKARRA